MLDEVNVVKRDAYTIGIALAFIAFVLMILTLIVESWRSEQSKRLAQSMKSTKTVVALETRDYSSFQTTTGDDGAKMVLVPEGSFPMGSPPSEGDSDEIPQRIVYISSFYIDLYEVTHALFSKYVGATRAAKPVIPVFSDDLSLITKPELPVVGVSWDQARDYCLWAGKRLPTEAEWEKAARGERALKWPWGNTFGEELANVEGEVDGYKYTAPPGRFEAGRSPYGLYDVAGNVAEWVADWYDPAYYQVGVFKDPKGPVKGTHRVYRGGSWNDSSANVRTAKRFAAAPHQSSAVIGFRCAKNSPD